jgi:hypothetical protein
MASNPQSNPQTISFTLDGKPLSALPGETLLQAAKRAGVCSWAARPSIRPGKPVRIWRSSRRWPGGQDTGV